MARSFELCRRGLVGGATVAVLTACGGSGGSDNASSSSAAGTTTAARTSTSAAADGGGSFCDQARLFTHALDATVDAGSAQRLGQALPMFASQLAALTPPAEIATDWQQAVTAVQQLTQDFQGVDLSDPQQLQQLQQTAQPAEAQLTAAGTRIEDYLSKQCGTTG